MQCRANPAGLVDVIGDDRTLPPLWWTSGRYSPHLRAALHATRRSQCPRRALVRIDLIYASGKKGEKAPCRTRGTEKR